MTAPFAINISAMSPRVSDTGAVVADAAELGALLHLVDSSGIVADVIHRVPELSEPLAVGLG